MSVTRDYRSTAEPARQLLRFARILSRVAGIRIVKGDAWGCNPATSTITVPAVDMEHGDPYRTAGLIAHEVGHLRISRYLLFSPENETALPSFALYPLLNSVEDPRVEYWMIRSYPGVARWLVVNHEAMREPRVSPETPDFTAFAWAALFDHPVYGQPRIIDGLNETVRQALDETREARWRYIDTVPATLVDDVFQDAASQMVRYRRMVIPRLTPDLSNEQVSLREMASRVSASQALDVFMREILPVAVRLWLPQRERHESTLQMITRRLSEVSRAEDGEQLLTLLARLVGSKSIAAWYAGAFLGTQGRFALSQRLLDAVESRAHAKSSDARYTSASVLDACDEGGAPLDNALCQEVMPIVDHLVTELRAILRTRKRLRLGSGYSSGIRIDMRRALLAESRPVERNRVWMRAVRQSRPDAAVSLLVDLSGSMCFGRIIPATQVALLTAESLARVPLPFEVHGFQNRLIPFITVGERYGEAHRKAIREMPMEVAGNRPHGNNCYVYNDDGPCLEEAASRLLHIPARRHILLVISDGHPEGEHSNEDDLRRVISRLNALPRFYLIGMGIGPSTDHVNQYYKHSHGSVPVDSFVEVFTRTLRNAITY